MEPIDAVAVSRDGVRTLEHPDWFPDLHSGLIYVMKESLQPILPGSYSARSDYRFWLEHARRSIEPDVEVVQGSQKPRRRSRGGVALMERASSTPLIIAVETIDQGPFRQVFLEIRHRRGKDVRLVTSIEILSPSNKKNGHPSRELYLDKQRKLLSSETHVVEIDLLRGGHIRWPFRESSSRNGRALLITWCRSTGSIGPVTSSSIPSP